MPSSDSVAIVARAPRLVDPWLPAAYEIANLLSEEQQTLTGDATATGVSGWSVGAGATIARSTRYQKYDPASLEVYVTSANAAVVHTENLVRVTAGKRYRVFGWVRTERIRATVRFGVLWANRTYQPTATDFAYVEQRISGNDGWTLLSLEVTAPSLSAGDAFDAVGGWVQVSLPDSEVGEELWIDDVVLTTYVKPSSAVTQLAARWIPEYLLLLDYEQDAPQWPMLRYFDVVAATATRILRASLAFDYVPAADGRPGFERSTLVDARFYPAADYAERRWLPWLAFITGCRPFAVRTAGSGWLTPWRALELSEAGAARSWSDWGGSWEGVESYAPEEPLQLIGDVDAVRAQGTGILAGTIEGIRRAARLALDPSYLDVPATFEQVGTNTVVATFATAQSFRGGVGQKLDVYATGDRTLDGRATVSAVGGDNKSLTLTVTGVAISELLDGYITERLVDVDTDPGDIWALTVSTEEAATPSLPMLTQVTERAKPAGCIITYEYTVF